MVVKDNEVSKDSKHVKESDHYKKQYFADFVKKWDELIDWEFRAEGEGDFFIRQLKKRGAKRILDVATGTGFHSVRLLEAGFDVVSADGSPEMLGKAFENAQKRGLVLSAVQADWRFLNRHVHGEFDAVICLGNSFTHLFNENDRRKALAEYYATLKHDGILIIDQRNYDSILDDGFSSKHKYYYCGKNVLAEPDYVDPDLARFKYQFRDNSKYYLNMYPLRKKYMRRLLREVGFQRIDTYGDFQAAYNEDDPDFFVHIANKKYISEDKNGFPENGSEQAAINTTKEYYNSGDADNFYFNIWGGEDVHVGIYAKSDETIKEASNRSVKFLADKLENLTPDSRILDMGSGYGGGARYLSKRFGCEVVALNLSDVENKRHRKINKEQGLHNLIDVVDGNFEKLPFEDVSFDFVWSQDAFLHSPNRKKIFEEVCRVLRFNGELIFTDPMQSDNCPNGVLEPIFKRIHLKSLSSPSLYRKYATQLGLKETDFVDLTDHLITHYKRVLDETRLQRDELKKKISAEYLSKMEEGLKHWVDGGLNGYLVWGCFHFCKN